MGDNPTRISADRWQYRLQVEADVASVMPIAAHLAELLLSAEELPLPACPACGRPGACHWHAGRPLPAGELACGFCGERWPADAEDRASVAAAWRLRTRITRAAVQLALPRTVARGEVAQPRADDLHGWARMGVADALLGRPPAHVPGPSSPPWSIAYGWGWTNAITVATAKRSPMTNTTDPITMTDLHAYEARDLTSESQLAAAMIESAITQSIDFTRAGQEIFDALVEAQSLVSAANKGGWNKNDHYAYTGTDDMTRASHDPLRRAGLALICAPTPVWDREALEWFSRATSNYEKPGQIVIGQLRFEWHLILHARGKALSMPNQRISGLTFAPIIAAVFRQVDKALAGASSYTRTYVIRDLLNIDRGEDPETDVDQRSAQEAEAARARKQQPRQQRPRQQAADRLQAQRKERGQVQQQQQQADADLGPWLTDADRIAELDSMLSQLAMLDDVEPPAVLVKALQALGLPTTIESKGKEYPIDRAKRLRVTQARLVSQWLDDRLGEAAADYDQDEEPPGEPPVEGDEQPGGDEHA